MSIAIKMFLYAGILTLYLGVFWARLFDADSMRKRTLASPFEAIE